jgi:ATP-dependent DNA helicase DinG
VEEQPVVEQPGDSAEETLRILDEVTAALPGGGEQRDGQRGMATAVAAAIADDSHVVVQAGTGTGKSLAYLVPVATSGKTTIVATATKALQDQLAGKDLPFLADRLPHGVRFAVLKGRSNYLCLQRLDEAEADDRLGLDLDDDAPARLDRELIDRLRSFAATTETGDRTELPEIDDRTWRLVSVGRDECPGACRCPVGDDCLAERARRKAATADVIVVNLHLYAIEVMIEGILPEHDLVVIDEAHQLEDIMSEAAGRQISPGRLHAAARAAGAVLADRDATVGVEEAATLLHARLEPMVGDRLIDGLDNDAGASIDVIRGRVEQLLNALRAVPKDVPADTAAKTLRARQAVTSLLDDIDYVRWPIDDEVLWVDGPARNPSLRSTPVAIDNLLAENLWAKRAAVLTSATMSAKASARLGLPTATPIMDVGSPFDYEKNALLYCPTDLPDPRADGHRDARLAELEALIVAAGGRTLALFTSWSAMRDAAEHLEPRLPWPILVQGEGSKMALLETFTNDDESCLFGTMSFWQGVDVPGSTCNLVVIDRLPFPRPDNPVLQARRERAGSAAFRTIDLPRAATLLAQGAGRLIRSANDRGVVAVLDSRLATSRNYRWDLFNALPPMRRTRDRSEVEELLRELRDGA